MSREGSMVKFIQLNETCYYFSAPVNIGYVHHGDEGLLIDAGIDDSVMRKVLRQLEEKNLPITHLFITHAHADHYGGASYLQERHMVKTMAPVFEAAILENPALEPLYLFGGNVPLKELRNKFLEGKPITVEEKVEEGIYSFGSFELHTYDLSGHSYHQLGLVVDTILYAGDSYFGKEQLHKHKIPYIVDAALTVETLEKIQTIDCTGAVPGHGEFEQEFIPTVKANLDYHHEVLDWTYETVCQYETGISHEQIIAKMCESYEVHAPTLAQWLLFRTAATAYVIGLIKAHKLHHTIRDYKWIFQKSD